MNLKLLVLVGTMTFQVGALAADLAQRAHGSQGASAAATAPAPAVKGTPKALVSPSIELTGYDVTPPGPNICVSTTAAADFSVTVLWTSSVPADSDSDLWELIVPGFGVVASLAESNVGYGSPALNVADSYGVGASDISVPYSVPANTIVTHRMSTWANNSRSGAPSFVSEMDVNCTTGAVVAIRNSDQAASAPVPVGGTAFSLLAAALLAASGLWVSRRRS